MPDPRRLVVVNTTPLIALSQLGLLDLLHSLYGEVVIPSAVQAELQAGGPSRVGSDALEGRSWIVVQTLRDPRRADLLADLDRGEAEVVALAQEMGADLVIIDERLARAHAARLGLVVTGTLGVLLRAKAGGLIPNLRPLLERMQTAGLHLRPDLLARVLELAGEVP
jgi:uncharacterized protein